MWLGLYATGYRYYLKHRDCSKNATTLDEMAILDNINASDGTNYHGSYSLTATYQELQDKYSCSKSVISKTLKELATLGFITRQRFFVKNDDENDNLHDKSIWRITVTLPSTLQQQLIKTKNRVQPAEKSVISNPDPYVSNSSQYLIKYFISNTKNLDSLDASLNFFENPLSELSVSYNNSIQEKEDSLLPLQKINTIESISIENSNSNNNQKSKSVKVTNVGGKPTLTATQKPADQIQQEDNSTTEANKNTKTKLALNTNPTQLTNTVKFSPNATLKDWYPLSPEDVDRLNSKAEREFSNNFVNELLLKLHRKYPDRIFPTKNHLLSYLAKALNRELHQAPMVNHQTFRFAKNDEEFMLEQQREKYLSAVEYNIDTNYEAQLKRKIAANFDPILAYQLLTQAKFTTTVQEQRSDNNYFDDQYLDIAPTTIIQEEDALSEDTLDEQHPDIIENSQDHPFTVKLNQEISLSDLQRQILENSITAVYGHVNIMYQQVQNDHSNLGKLPQRQQGEMYLEELDPNSTWYKMRVLLKEQFGDSIDKAYAMFDFFLAGN